MLPHPSRLKRRRNRNNISLLPLLPLLLPRTLFVGGRRHPYPNAEEEDGYPPDDDYTHGNDYGPFDHDEDPAHSEPEDASAIASSSLGPGDVGMPATTNHDNNADNSNEFKWISPSGGDTLPSGQSMTVTWSSSNTLHSPSISLCTFDPKSNTPDCGGETWPAVRGNAEGTFSAIVTMPVISQSIEKLYLSLNSDGQMFNSPVFGVQGDSGVPNAYLASPVYPSTIPTASVIGTAPTLTPTPLSETVSASGIEEVSSSTKSIIDTGSTITKAKSTIRASNPVSYGMSAYPSVTRLQTQTPAQVQMPLQVSATAGTPLSMFTQTVAVNPTFAPDPNPNPAALIGSTTTGTARTNTMAKEPNVKAIALPISICGLILLAALIYCARSKMFRKTGLGQGSSQDVEKNWQDAIKEKAASGKPFSMQKSNSGLRVSDTQGVEVRERREKEQERDGLDDVPTLGYKGRRRLDRDRRDVVYDRNGVGDREERFTQIPRVDYERAGKGGFYRTYNADGDHYRERGRDEDGHRRHHRHKHRRESERQRQKERDRELVNHDYPSDYPNRDDYLEGRSKDSQSRSYRDYYSTHRRSSTGIGGIYDDRDRDRDRDRPTYDSYGSHSSNTNSSSSSKRRPLHDMYLDRHDMRYSRSESRESGINLNRSQHRSTDTERPSTRTLYEPPHPPRARPPIGRGNESYVGELSNPFDPPLPPISTSTTRRMSSRPLPIPGQIGVGVAAEPIIRSSTGSSSSDSQRTLAELEDYEGMIRQKSCALPHISGGLRDDAPYAYVRQGHRQEHTGRDSHRARGRDREKEREREREFESDTEAGWDLANEGRYKTGDEGMGELYESLRRAIQRT
ncbi:uncharacterized protein I303_106841 [Kwoniella dejecticola CBS 10117]|uniref:Uncharacterized protein n=1 Tax=Kwoniella dejecticola CBS 10117 TaxID=1296121 RepID=A0A1A5ZTJ0_9TREE|nr:uncharacterized protein I303_08517 [Kwoniella dejecticola CBS 10117]OBR81134.1 hypothetical protein I303_08517 [Kwoniella dejecticola CBS 10117]